MIKFNFKKSSLLPLSVFQEKKHLVEFSKILKDKDLNSAESFLNLPEKPFSFDFKKNEADLILLIGIGGSSRGAQAIYQALKSKRKLKELLVLDSLNPIFLKEVFEKAKRLKKGRLAIFVVSKSGKTTESLANFSTLLKNVKKYQPKVFTISEKDSLLWQAAEKRNFSTFPFPKKVAGRYSVFSNAGLLPLALAGVNTKELLSGARRANNACLEVNSLKNPALSFALNIFYHQQLGKNIYVNFVFPPNLEDFGKWHQQLMAESLGKDGKGLTPIVSLGTTDFHSLGQLYFDGPKDKLISFVFVEDLDQDFKIGGFLKIKGDKIWNLNSIIFKGVKKAFLKKKVPFIETILPKLDEENLGFLMQAKMIETIILARFMKVNPFDQPGVELYKEEVKKMLKG